MAQLTPSIFFADRNDPQVFTSASTAAFKTFACDHDAVDGESYLRADYSISCKSRMHMFFKVYAGLMILVSVRACLLAYSPRQKTPTTLKFHKLCFFPKTWLQLPLIILF